MQQDQMKLPNALRHGTGIALMGHPAQLPSIPSSMVTGSHREGQKWAGGRSASMFPKPEHLANRSVHSIPVMKFADVRVSAAESQAEFESACGLVHERYRSRGYDLGDATRDAHAPGWDARATHQITFVATHRNSTIGTITLGLDGPHGLRAEETHRDVVQDARAAGRRLCELTRLAVADNIDSRPVLASLFNLAHTAADTIHGVTDVFIEVNPRHVVYYSRVLGFVVAANETLCERVQAPSVLLHVEMDPLAGRLKALARRASLLPVLARSA